jgi:hypothetical protein
MPAEVNFLRTRNEEGNGKEGRMKVEAPACLSSSTFRNPIRAGKSRTDPEFTEGVAEGLKKELRIVKLNNERFALLPTFSFDIQVLPSINK